MSGSKLPHSLRIIIFFLRITLGLNFFYLGFSALFNPPLGKELGARSLGDLYAWIGAAVGDGPLKTFYAWAFLIIGACLLIGLLARVAAIAGITLTVLSYAPSLSIPTLTPSEFANDGLLVAICLLIIVFSNAGEYLGLDRFIHIHLSGKHKK